MLQPWFLDIDHTMRLHRSLIETYGGSEGIREVGLLHSALAMPQSSFGGEFLELIPHRRIRYTDRFDDPNMPGEIHVSVELAEVKGGTELRVTQSGIPEMIPLEMCHLGWQESLAQLAALVEPNMP